MSFDVMTEGQQEKYWAELSWETAEIATAAVGGWRRETAKKLMKSIQDTFDQHGFGPVGTPAIAIYAEELAMLARLPYSDHESKMT